MSALTEEDLIKSRPLLFESRPFLRIHKRITSLLPTPATPLPTPPELDLDFASFTSVLSRLSLLHATNAAEIQRYNAEKTSILATSEGAKTGLVTLREDLISAHAEKQNRLSYDVIAEDILSSRSLRPRKEAEEATERLKVEIEELERERDEYENVWGARRAQFDVIVEQLERMWRQIKEEKDEHDRREGMSEDEDEEAAAAAGSGAVKGGLMVVAAEGGEGCTPVPVVEEPAEEGEREEGEEVEDDDDDMVDLVARGRTEEVDRMDTS